MPKAPKNWKDAKNWPSETELNNHEKTYQPPLRSVLFERSGNAGVTANGSGATEVSLGNHFERSSGTAADPSRSFERSGSTGSSLSRYFERQTSPVPEMVEISVMPQEPPKAPGCHLAS